MKFRFIRSLVVALATRGCGHHCGCADRRRTACRGEPTRLVLLRPERAERLASDPVNNPHRPTRARQPRPTGRVGPVTPVPEPGEWAMMLAGLALVGFIVRRNSKRS